jgi:hypothetical protein
MIRFLYGRVSRGGAQPEEGLSRQEVPTATQPRVDVAGKVFAASWIAVRMRAYVAQRQMLPAMAASISESVGLEFVANSAAADMTCPL